MVETLLSQLPALYSFSSIVEGLMPSCGEPLTQATVVTS